MNFQDYSQLWSQIPGYAAMKNSQGIYLTCNINLAILMGLQSPSQIQGLSDFELPDYSEENYNFHRKNDVLALRGQTVHCIHRSSLPYDGSYYYLIKKPIMNKENAIIGILYHCMPLVQSDFIKQLIAYDAKNNGTHHKPHEYYIDAVDNPFQLSHRELECLFFTLRAMTAKQIAEQLNLSKRTIEFYLENIKNKMRCVSKAELICLAISSGYLRYIPPSFLSKKDFISF
ncbi:transcriptional regulator LuxR [Legionella gratiana]|uniref:Transcriptional regulator LuxR n=1 Tax=Legionella gratiana TaxID=45066 RepID=A0A378JBJ6_9GAMM|nr:LuxR family transcriptional regulator [Legionella gratiana]KTD06365.1 transcriptional regulator LuxR [Legionella gratiana]STX45183.1 transcriptional regulator LuxR [Legionella gratiana]